MNILEITLIMDLIGMIRQKKNYGSIDIGMKEMTTYKVYMVECSDGSIYTGITTNVDRRMEQHSKGIGSKYVRARLPISLQWLSESMDLSSALKMEHHIKSWNREKKLKWICLLYTSPSPRDATLSRMPSSA